MAHKDYRRTDSNSTQIYVAHKLEHQRHIIASRTRPHLDGLPLRALHVILKFSIVLGRLATFRTNRALRAAVHANKDIFADLSFQYEYQGSLPLASLRYLVSYTGDPLQLRINLPLQSSETQHDDVLEICQPHLSRARSLYIGAYWEDRKV